MPQRSKSWSRIEVEATVASYFDMLEAGLHGDAVNKTAHRNAVLRLLSNRSAAAVERKHQNISAILIEERVPYISGYKPLGNYQELLRDVVLEHLLARRSTHALIEAEVERVPVPSAFGDILAAWVDPPEPRAGLTRTGSSQRQDRRRAPVDYLQLEARNRALGRAGEEFVIRFEQERLIAARRERLASQITHTAVTEGDGAGYDVLSFAEDGRERLIEVKTTKFGEYTPFYVTRNELTVSQTAAPTYHLYRLYLFGSVTKLFVVSGALDESFALEASNYVAKVG